MQRWLVYLGGGALGLVILYGSIAALVNQGLSLLGALVMLLVIVGGAIGLLYAVKQ